MTEREKREKLFVSTAAGRFGILMGALGWRGRHGGGIGFFFMVPMEHQNRDTRE